MLRSIIIYLSQADWARRLITSWSVARRAASRFIAGEKLDDAIQVIKALNSKNINATLDHLGEHTSTPEKAIQAANDIIEIIQRIHKEGVRSGVSIKLTQIGLQIDEQLCAENLDRIIQAAVDREIFVRIDMEDSPWVEKTIALFKKARKHCGSENIGIVIQSYLYRSREDVSDFMRTGTRIRICKGAYKEPEHVAFPHKADVDANFDQIVLQLLDGSIENGIPVINQEGRFPPIPAIATHDVQRIEFAKQALVEKNLPKAAIEFQMLHGIRRDLQESLAQEGYPVRVYVPYGSEWYPYYTRRLAERPANLWFFISNFFR